MNFKNKISELITSLKAMRQPTSVGSKVKKFKLKSLKELSGSESMNRNAYHLIAAIASGLILCFWLATGIGAVHHFDLRKTNKPEFAGWIALLVLTQLFAIGAGVMQLIYNPGTSTTYAGWLTIFASNLFFPPFVSFTFYMRSGLTAKKQAQQIRLFVIDFLPDFEAALKEKGLVVSKETRKQLDTITALQKKNLLDTFNGNAYKLSLIENEVPYNSWPQIWNNDEIVAIANDVVFTPTK